MAGRKRQELCREVGRDDEGSVALPRFDLIHGLIVVDELPVELVVAVQLVDDHLADVDMTREFAIGPLVLVHHAHV